MPPTKFLDQHISIDQDLANMAWMIPSDLVILNPFVLAVILVIKLLDPIFEIFGVALLPVKLLFFEWDDFNILILVSNF